jgi:ribonuclease BN (tRNA processing enzyme)
VGETALPKFELLGEHPPAAMVLTHAHLDHVGALPLVTTRFPRLPISCTEATARLADTLKVSTEQGYPLFGPSQMKRALERLRPITRSSRRTRWSRGVPTATACCLRGEEQVRTFVSAIRETLAAGAVAPSSAPHLDDRRQILVLR